MRIKITIIINQYVTKSKIENISQNQYYIPQLPTNKRKKKKRKGKKR